MRHEGEAPAKTRGESVAGGGRPGHRPTGGDKGSQRPRHAVPPGGDPAPVLAIPASQRRRGTGPKASTDGARLLLLAVNSSVRLSGSPAPVGSGCSARPQTYRQEGRSHQGRGRRSSKRPRTRAAGQPPGPADRSPSRGTRGRAAGAGGGEPAGRVSRLPRNQQSQTGSPRSCGLTLCHPNRDASGGQRDRRSSGQQPARRMVVGLQQGGRVPGARTRLNHE